MQKSLMSNDIEKSRLFITEEIVQIKKLLDIKTAMPPRVNIHLLREYDDIMTALPMAARKKRKTLSRRKEILEDECKFFREEYAKFVSVQHTKLDLGKKEAALLGVDSRIKNDIGLHVKILTENKFIVDNTLTEKGLLAANIQEMHCLAMADILIAKTLNDLEVSELAAVLSIFTSVSVRQDNSVVKVSHITAPENVKQIISDIKTAYNKYYDIESYNKTDFVNDYDIHYNMCELVYRWCKASTEEECYKIFNEAIYYNISRGEFVKAMLKINNVAHELEKLAELQSNIALLEKAKLIPTVTMKSIATNQSLYL